MVNERLREETGSRVISTSRLLFSTKTPSCLVVSLLLSSTDNDKECRFLLVSFISFFSMSFKLACLVSLSIFPDSLLSWQPILSLSSQQFILHHGSKTWHLRNLFSFPKLPVCSTPCLAFSLFSISLLTEHVEMESIPPAEGKPLEPVTACHIPKQFAQQRNNQLQQ